MAMWFYSKERKIWKGDLYLSEIGIFILRFYYEIKLQHPQINI